MPPATAAQPLDEKAKRTLLRRLPYTVAVLTSVGEGSASAATITWMAQCSFKPPLLMLALRTGSMAHRNVAESRALALNFLDEDQKELAGRFFQAPIAEGGVIAGAPYHTGTNGCPILDEAAAWLAATVRTIVPAGDHDVFVVEVTAALIVRDCEPLTLRATGWTYGG